jgi:GDPmannose 4,6-dehydratase
LRGETFVTRKITRAAAQIALGMTDKLFVGNLDASRDWGHAKDYVEAMWLMLQQPQPEDFVIATGITTKVRDFIRMTFEELEVELEFKGSGKDEKGYVKSSSGKYSLKPGQEVVAVDPNYFRPTEVDLLIGDATKAKEKLGWQPKYTLSAMVKEMVACDIEFFRKHKTLVEAGFHVLPQHE